MALFELYCNRWNEGEMIQLRRVTKSWTCPIAHNITRNYNLCDRSLCTPTPNENFVTITEAEAHDFQDVHTDECMPMPTSDTE